MSFEDNIRALAARVPATLAHLETEEATKNALVLPFIAAMGYDVFNPLEVVPEYTADVGTKRGEKVDYAIKYGGDIVMLMEAKKAEAELTLSHASQLYRYFSVTDTSRIALLSNGVIYKFYSDIDAPNRMDEKPFLVVDLMNLKDDQLSQLSKLTKDAFDLDGMLEAAGALKYMREIRRILSKQYDEPDDEFVRFFFAQCCPSRNFVQSARVQFSKLVVSSMHQVVADRVSARLRSALERETEVGDSTAPAGDSPSGRPKPPPCRTGCPSPLTIEPRLGGWRRHDRGRDRGIQYRACDRLQRRGCRPRDDEGHQELLRDPSRRQQPTTHLPSAFQPGEEVRRAVRRQQERDKARARANQGPLPVCRPAARCRHALQRGRALKAHRVGGGRIARRIALARIKPSPKLEQLQPMPPWSSPARVATTPTSGPKPHVGCARA